MLSQRGDAVARYLEECRELGFDIVEISSGFVTLPVDDLVRLTKAVSKAGLKAKPEVGIQFGAGGASTVEALEAEGTRDVGQAIELAKRHLDAGAHMIMIESEGITEQVREWRTDVVARIVSELGLEQVMFEAADPDVFSWYIKNYGIDVNLFVDHSQIVQLECLRAGIWGTQDTWGRMLAYRPKDEALTPETAIRSRRAKKRRLELRPRPPFRLDLTVWALRRRAQNETDTWDGRTYRRALLVHGAPLEVAVTQVGAASAPRLEVALAGRHTARSAETAARSALARLLGIDLDLSAFYARAARDPVLNELAERYRGLKAPLPERL